MKIGFLSHLSPTYPLLLSDMLEAIQMQMNEGDELISEFLGANGTETEIKEKAQTLFLKGAEVLIVYSSFPNLQEVQKIADLMNKKAVLIDAGFYKNKQRSPKGNVVWLSLQLAEAYCCLAYSKENISGQKLGIISDFMNSGYIGGYYVTESHHKSGGEIGFQFVIPMGQTAESNLETIQRFILESETDQLFVNTNKHNGDAILNLVKSEAIQKQRPNLKVLLGDEYMQAKEINARQWASNQWACVNWLSPMEKNSFMQSFEEKVGRIPSIFAALACEATEVAKQQLKGEITNFEGPRGQLIYNMEEGYFYAQQRLISNTAGDFNIQEVAYEVIPFVLENTGWKNPYLCY